MTEGLLVLHVFVGLLFAAHGAQKLFGAFGGPGIQGVTGFMGSLGPPARSLSRVASGVIEFAGGLLIALGLVTPVAAAGLIAVMVTAILTVHLANGFFNQDGGVEFNVLLIAVLFALSAIGPGDDLARRRAGHRPGRVRLGAGRPRGRRRRRSRRGRQRPPARPPQRVRPSPGRLARPFPGAGARAPVPVLPRWALFDLNGTLLDPSAVGEDALAAAVHASTVDSMSGAYRPLPELLRAVLERDGWRTSTRPWSASRRCPPTPMPALPWTPFARPGCAWGC